MNTIDFLSSDIEFPCDSNEPKLSASPCTKLPESVDWSFHDYYSTVLEKKFTPIQSITDIRHLEPEKEKMAPPNYLQDWKNPSLFSVHEKQDDQAVIFVLANTIKPTQPSSQSLKQNNLRAALRGALDLVENDMQKNMQDRFTTPTYIQPRSDYNYLSWKDDILTETLHIGALDQDLWDDEDEDEILCGDASPAYHVIDENPIIDSSLASRISSIMPLSSAHSIRSRHNTQQENSWAQHTAQITTINESSAPMVPSVAQSSVETVKEEATTTTLAPTKSKIKSWNVWAKVKQATSKQFKSAASSKNAIKRLFH